MYRPTKLLITLHIQFQIYIILKQQLQKFITNIICIKLKGLGLFNIQNPVLKLI